nr:type II toxin-antitoxin system ParD family antitoxin [uncultured Halomonas sp.]
MHVSPAPARESRVKAKLDTRLYNNVSEVIREALPFMGTHQDWIHEVKLARLREQLGTGIKQLDRGEGVVIKGKAALDALFTDSRAEHLQLKRLVLHDRQDSSLHLK